MKKVIMIGCTMIVLSFVLAGCGNEPSSSATSNKGASVSTSETVSSDVSSTASQDSSIAADSGNTSSTRKKIYSSSLLTDETTGKGIISFGDSVEKVKQTLMGYQTDNGSTFNQDIKNQYGEFFWFGNVSYSFDTGGRLNGIGSSSGGGAFETSKGLRLGDPISKLFSLYGKNYSYNDGGDENLPSYTFDFGNTGMMVVISNGQVYEMGYGMEPNN